MTPAGKRALILLALLGVSGVVVAQSLGDLIKRAAEDAVRTAVKSVPVPGPAAPSPADAPPAAAPSNSAPPLLPSTALPPGWQPREPHPAELSFVAPQATVKVATEVRQLSTDIRDEKKFQALLSERILIDNPYLDPADPFFNELGWMTCQPDGSLAVFASAKLHKDGYMKDTPYATGIWRVAPDGAITAIGGARHTITEGRYPFCGVPAARSGLVAGAVGPPASAADGSVIFPYAANWGFGRRPVVLRLTPDARLEPVPNDLRFCALEPPEPFRKRFDDVSAAALDPQGNAYLFDVGTCTLYRTAPDGEVSTLLSREQACPRGRPENIVRADRMAWDSTHGELVTAGDLLWLKSPDTDNYSTIWRIRPDGSFRRVFLGRKLGKGAQQVDGIGGLALDAKGTIHFGAGIYQQGGGYQIMQLDEAKGRAYVVTGTQNPINEDHRDGPAREALFRKVHNLCFAPDDTLYVQESRVIRKMTTKGQVTTWAF